MQEDLSYSGIVDYLQGDENLGAELIVHCATEIEENAIKIVELTKELNSLQQKNNYLFTGATFVSKHLKKELPLYISRKKSVIILSDLEISIERNKL